MIEEPLLIRTLKGARTERTPFWFMRQAGRYLPEYRALRAKSGGFLNMCYSPAIAAEITLQPIHRFGMDAAILFSDILVVPHALGTELHYAEGEGPQLSTVTDAAGLAKLDASKVASKLSCIGETVSRVRAGLSPGTALIGFAGSPWTVACYMVNGKGGDFSGVLELSRRDPAFFQALISLLVESTLEYLSMQIEQGAQAIQLFDSWAGLLEGEEFIRWSIAPTQEMVRRLKARYPELPVIGFPRGAGKQILPYAKDTGVDAVGIDETLPLAWVRDTLQPHVCVQGNLGNQLLMDDAQAALAQADAILSALAAGPFVFNLGHGILQHTPVAHVEALSHKLRDYRKEG